MISTEEAKKLIEHGTNRATLEKLAEALKRNGTQNWWKVGNKLIAMAGVQL